MFIGLLQLTLKRAIITLYCDTKYQQPLNKPCLLCKKKPHYDYSWRCSKKSISSITYVKYRVFFSVHKAYSMYANLQTFNVRLGIFLWNGNWDVVEYHYISMTGLIPLVGASGCNPNLLLCESIPSLSFSREKNLLYKGHKTFHIRSHTPRPKTTFRHLYNKYANEWRKLEIVFLVCH